MQSFGCTVPICATGYTAIASGCVLGRSSTSVLKYYLMLRVMRQTVRVLSSTMAIWAARTCSNRTPWLVQDGCNSEDFINSTCAPSSPTKVINHSDPAASVAPSHLPLLHHGQGQVRPAGPLTGADVVLPQQKRRRTASSHQPSASHVPAAMGNSSGAVDSARPQALSNPIDHIFQFHKASLLCFLQHLLVELS